LPTRSSPGSPDPQARRLAVSGASVDEVTDLVAGVAGDVLLQNGDPSKGVSGRDIIL
jgi:hypothetical protein